MNLKNLKFSFKSNFWFCDIIGTKYGVVIENAKSGQFWPKLRQNREILYFSFGSNLKHRVKLYKNILVECKKIEFYEYEEKV